MRYMHSFSSADFVGVALIINIKGEIFFFFSFFAHNKLGGRIYIWVLLGNATNIQGSL